MSIKISGYNFEGPYESTDNLYESSGVYVILFINGSGQYVPVDVGGSDGIKTRVAKHDRKDCWKKHSQGRIFVAVFYTINWVDLEKFIRNQFNCPCGDH